MPPQAAGMSCYSVAVENTPVCADFLVVDAVPPNRSARTKFPANRENNWECFDIWLFRRKITGRNVRVFRALRGKFPKQQNRELFSANREFFQ
jgi:hypothetical protein